MVKAIEMEKVFYTVDEASEWGGVPVAEIVDAVRLKQVDDWGEDGIVWQLASGTSVRRRGDMRIVSPQLDHMLQKGPIHRYYALERLADAHGNDEETVRWLRRCLAVWEGALFDNPRDKEAYGVVQALRAFALPILARHKAA